MFYIGSFKISIGVYLIAIKRKLLLFTNALAYIKAPNDVSVHNRWANSLFLCLCAKIKTNFETKKRVKLQKPQMSLLQLLLFDELLCRMKKKYSNWMCQHRAIKFNSIWAYRLGRKVKTCIDGSCAVVV